MREKHTSVYLLNRGTDLVNRSSDLLNQGTDLVNPGTDLVNRCLDNHLCVFQAPGVYDLLHARIRVDLCPRHVLLLVYYSHR